ncbi:MAG: hypothetical protein WBC09_05485, partial [Thermoanaerobaculia bacterium]
GLDCGTDCQECYYEGMSIELLATPDIGSEFAGWSGDTDCSDGVLAMSSNTNCTAAFDPCSIDPTVHLPEPLETINEETTFEACNILSAGSDNSDVPDVFTLGPLADVTFRSGNQIVIKNGFRLEMEAGAKFRAIVGPP